jgi:L-ascorbate metabolism protein UlaG (beta-lactamase superfamily)
MAGSTERLTWIGHATVLLEIGGARLLTDPLLRDRIGHLLRHGASPAPAATEALDAVLVSHLHLDHFHAASLRQLPRDVTVLAPVGAGDLLRRLGFARTTEVRVGEPIRVGGATVTAVPAEHDGRRHPLGRVAEAIGFVIAGDRRVYFAGDTDLYDGMGETIGPTDAALLPIWGWGPSLGPGHLDPAEAAKAVALVQPALAVPIHWGTFLPIGLHRRHGGAVGDPPVRFAAQVASAAPATRVVTLAPGESLSA